MKNSTILNTPLSMFKTSLILEFSFGKHRYAVTPSSQKRGIFVIDKHCYNKLIFCLDTSASLPYNIRRDVRQYLFIKKIELFLKTH